MLFYNYVILFRLYSSFLVLPTEIVRDFPFNITMKSRRFRVHPLLLIFLYTILLLLCLVRLADADRRCCEQVQGCRIPRNCRCFVKEHVCRQSARNKFTLGKRSATSSSTSSSSSSPLGRVEDNVISYILSKLYWGSLDGIDFDYHDEHSSSSSSDSSSFEFLYRIDNSEDYGIFINGLQDYP